MLAIADRGRRGVVVGVEEGGGDVGDEGAVRDALSHTVYCSLWAEEESQSKENTRSTVNFTLRNLASCSLLIFHVTKITFPTV